MITKMLTPIKIVNIANNPQIIIARIAMPIPQDFLNILQSEALEHSIKPITRRTVVQSAHMKTYRLKSKNAF